MAQQRLSDQMMGGKGDEYQYTDTTYTKIFVGGLAWETRREHMKHYFEQFGAIEEAVVITEKSTGRSKGYGFVTFKDPNAAMRACQNPYPVIDGRRTNCNLAYLGANRTGPSTPQYYGKGSFRPPTPPPASMAPPSYEGSSMAYLQQQLAYYAFPYSSYGYNGCSQDNMFPMQIYPSGGQQFPNYYTLSATSIMPRISPNSYALYAQFAQSGQVQGYEIKYPSMVQYAYIPQPYSTSVFLPALPSSTSVTNTAGVLGGIATVPRDTKAAPGSICNQNSSV